MTSLINISSIVSHGKNSIDVNIPNPLLFSICTPTDLTTNNVSIKYNILLQYYLLLYYFNTIYCIKKYNLFIYYKMISVRNLTLQ